MLILTEDRETKGCLTGDGNMVSIRVYSQSSKKLKNSSLDYIRITFA